MAGDDPDDDEESTTTEKVEVGGRRVDELARTSPTIVVLTGPRTGQSIKLVETLVIGRAAPCEIVVDDLGVSRRHTRVRFDGESAWVEDLGSSNGTFVNGKRLTSETRLADGDKVQIGQTVMRFAFHDSLDDRFQEYLVESALRDGLTKLNNKRYLMERLDAELKFAARHDTALSLLMIDIDHFKTVNDTHGHLAGDAVLVRVAEVLAGAVRDEDVVARFGGEEFAIVLRAIGDDGAATTAERLRGLVEEAVASFAESELRVTISIGVASFPTTRAYAPEELVDAADQALYRAKRGGRNRVAR